MQTPASFVPLKNIFLFWTESSDQSALNRPLATWSEAEDAIHSMTAVAPEYGYDKTRFRIEWADGEVYEVRLDIARVVVQNPMPSRRARPPRPGVHFRPVAPRQHDRGAAARVLG